MNYMTLVLIINQIEKSYGTACLNLASLIIDFLHYVPLRFNFLSKIKINEACKGKTK